MLLESTTSFYLFPLKGEVKNNVCEWLIKESLQSYIPAVFLFKGFLGKCGLYLTMHRFLKGEDMLQWSPRMGLEPGTAMSKTEATSNGAPDFFY